MTLALAVFGHVIIDQTVVPGGQPKRSIGGAGMYAVVGMRLVTAAPVGITSGVGSCFAPEFGPWMRDWGIDASALAVRGEATATSIVDYASEESRTETLVHGLDHFATMRPRAADLALLAQRPTGIYVFGDASREIWDELLSAYPEASVLWEVSAAMTGRAGWEHLLARLPDVDVVSLNQQESAALGFADDPDAIVSQLLDHGAPIAVLRNGAAGSVVASKEEAWRVGIPQQMGPVVDPTGAGNAYSGAFLAALLSEGGGLRDAARRAACAASYVVEQYGPPAVPPPDPHFLRRLRSVGSERATVTSAPPVFDLSGICPAP